MLSVRKSRAARIALELLTGIKKNTKAGEEKKNANIHAQHHPQADIDSLIFPEKTQNED
jgi:hypothetical protein